MLEYVSQTLELIKSVRAFVLEHFDRRLRRWKKVVHAHGLEEFDALVRLRAYDESTLTPAKRRDLLDALNVDVLRATSAAFNIRFEWLMGRDNRPYDFMLLDRSFTPLVAELLEWQRIGASHGIAAFKTGTAEIDDDPSQGGALVLFRETFPDDGDSPYSFRPIFSLQSWGNSAQRYLALRAIWAAWHLGYCFRGYRATRRQCEGIRLGSIFPSTIREDWGVGEWHPDDYVVRPSAQRRGDDTLVTQLELAHSHEFPTWSSNGLRRALG